MPKNIVICIDGTSDFAAERPTHVFRLFKSLERSSAQLCYYDGGIGTLRDSSPVTKTWEKFLQKLDLAVATSIHRSFKEAYRFLVNNYEAGDRIFLFGFSRGAYTVRMLAGAIKLFGILHPEQENIIPYVWQTFHDLGDSDDADEMWAGIGRMKSAFGRSADVAYLGAWDTVSSVGFIKVKVYPQTYKLSAVSHVRHAVAIDERRNMFPPNKIALDQPGHYECWFSGVHRDIGGGGSAEALNLSMIPFRWVIDGALVEGLRLDQDKVSKMFEITPDSCGKDNSNKLVVIAFSLLSLIPMKSWNHRKKRFSWKWLSNWVWTRNVPDGAWVHPSVKERLNCPAINYTPKNLNIESVQVGEPGE